LLLTSEMAEGSGQARSALGAQQSDDGIAQGGQSFHGMACADLAIIRAIVAEWNACT
jgi:hypothetical protein